MRIFITGSTDGLGRAAALTLINEGHQVVLHARSKKRASALADLAPRSAGVVIGDLALAAETRGDCRSGQQDRTHGRRHSQRRHLPRAEPRYDARRPRESSRGEHAGAVHADQAHRAARASDLSQQRHASRWRGLTARHRLVRAALGYEPGVLGQQALRHRARHGGRQKVAKDSEQRGGSGLGAYQDGRAPVRPDDLEQGHLTQTWLATSDEPAAKVSGGFWFHRKQQKPAAAALDVAFQDRLIARLTELTGVALF